MTVNSNVKMQRRSKAGFVFRRESTSIQTEEKQNFLPLFMTDTHDKATRSYNMSRIRSTNTKPERMVRQFLFSNGFRYRLNVKTLPGKPDIVLTRLKTIIFVHGCFWHGHANCRYASIPKTRTAWWTEKINRNKANDKRSIRTLRKDGWTVIIVWECRLKKNKAEATLEKLIAKLPA